MSKFCPKCGSPMNDGDLFCASCGARQEAPPAGGVNVSANAAPPAYQSARNQYYPPEPYAEPAQAYVSTDTPPSQYPPKKSKKGLFIGLGIGGAVLIAGVIILIILLTGGLKQGTPEELIETAKNAVQDSANNNKPIDEKYYDLIFEYHFAKPDYKELAKTSLTYEFSMMMSSYIKEYFGENIAINYTIEDSKTENISEQADYLLNSQYVDIDISKVQEIRTYQLNIQISGSKDTMSNSLYPYLIKYDGKWYISAASFY